jgi:5-hydroxyisourate hydrolase
MDPGVRVAWLRVNVWIYVSEDSMTTGYLTTHVLDTARGRPAAGLTLHLYRLLDDGRERLVSAVTDADGRCQGAILAGEAFRIGRYELEFEVGAWLLAAGHAATAPLFLDVVPIRFGIADAAAHYHVPLLLSPYGYTTYRGS